ncbi:LOW QUALITY PROTEIN: Interferon alpha-inducible protein 27-like protein 2A, partial [Galemys pyrenaicus]
RSLVRSEHRSISCPLVLTVYQPVKPSPRTHKWPEQAGLERVLTQAHWLPGTAFPAGPQEGASTPRAGAVSSCPAQHHSSQQGTQVAIEEEPPASCLPPPVGPPSEWTLRGPESQEEDPARRLPGARGRHNQEIETHPGLGAVASSSGCSLWTSTGNQPVKPVPLPDRELSQQGWGELQINKAAKAQRGQLVGLGSSPLGGRRSPVPISRSKHMGTPRRDGNPIAPLQGAEQVRATTCTCTPWVEQVCSCSGLDLPLGLKESAARRGPISQVPELGAAGDWSLFPQDALCSYHKCPAEKQNSLQLSQSSGSTVSTTPEAGATARSRTLGRDSDSRGLELSDPEQATCEISFDIERGRTGNKQASDRMKGENFKRQFNNNRQKLSLAGDAIRDPAEMRKSPAGPLGSYQLQPLFFDSTVYVVRWRGGLRLLLPLSTTRVGCGLSAAGAWEAGGPDRRGLPADGTGFVIRGYDQRRGFLEGRSQAPTVLGSGMLEVRSVSSGAASGRLREETALRRTQSDPFQALFQKLLHWALPPFAAMIVTAAVGGGESLGKELNSIFLWALAMGERTKGCQPQEVVGSGPRGRHTGPCRDRTFRGDVERDRPVLELEGALGTPRAVAGPWGRRVAPRTAGTGRSSGALCCPLVSGQGAMTRQAGGGALLSQLDWFFTGGPRPREERGSLVSQRNRGKEGGLGPASRGAHLQEVARSKPSCAQAPPPPFTSQNPAEPHPYPSSIWGQSGRQGNLTVLSSTVGAVWAAPVVLSAVGFTGAGIAASSIASSMMSAAAITNGGGVAAGGLVATLQSAGMAGLSAAANVALGAVGTKNEEEMPYPSASVRACRACRSVLCGAAGQDSGGSGAAGALPALWPALPLMTGLGSPVLPPGLGRLRHDLKSQLCSAARGLLQAARLSLQGLPTGPGASTSAPVGLGRACRWTGLPPVTGLHRCPRGPSLPVSSLPVGSSLDHLPDHLPVRRVGHPALDACALESGVGRMATGCRPKGQGPTLACVPSCEFSVPALRCNLSAWDAASGSSPGPVATVHLETHQLRLSSHLESPPAPAELTSGDPPAPAELTSGDPPAPVELTSGDPPAPLRLSSHLETHQLRLSSHLESPPALAELTSGDPPAPAELTSGDPPAPVELTSGEPAQGCLVAQGPDSTPGPLPLWAELPLLQLLYWLSRQRIRSQQECWVTPKPADSAPAGSAPSRASLPPWPVLGPTDWGLSLLRDLPLLPSASRWFGAGKGALVALRTSRSPPQWTVLPSKGRTWPTRELVSGPKATQPTPSAERLPPQTPHSLLPWLLPTELTQPVRTLNPLSQGGGGAALMPPLHLRTGGLQCVLVAGSMSFAQAGMLACSLASKVMSAASLASAGGAASGSVLAGLSKVGSALHAQGALAQALSTLGPLLGTLKGSSVLASSATVLRASPLAAPVSTAATVAAAPVVLSAVGFTSSGIAASSLAAKMMSVAAIANGGGVAAGSLVATLQSAGQCPGAGGGGRAALTREHAGPVETLTASLSSSPWASLWGFCGHALAGRSSGLVCAGSGSGPDTRLGGWVLSARLSQSCSRS